MQYIDWKKTVEYIEEHSYDGMTYDSPDQIIITGKQFAIAKLSQYAQFRSYNALIKFIEEKGGIIKEDAVASADYIIISPLPIKEGSWTYKKQLDKYEKAVKNHQAKGKPQIIRDIDFYIVNNMFSKLAMDDKRRVVMEYVNGNPCFTEKSKDAVIRFIKKQGSDDFYLKTKNIKIN